MLVTEIYRKRARVNLEGRFLVRIIYDDLKTYDLVGAATEVLGKTGYDYLIILIIMIIFFGFGYVCIVRLFMTQMSRTTHDTRFMTILVTSFPELTRELRKIREK